MVSDPKGILKDKNKIYRKYQFEFNLYLRTINQASNVILNFTCKSSDECDLWVHTFQWIVNCNCYMNDFAKQIRADSKDGRADSKDGRAESKDGRAESKIDINEQSAQAT